MGKRRFVGGNWKSNCTLTEAKALQENLAALETKSTDVVIAPVSVHLGQLVRHPMKSTQLAAQNCSAKGFGAFTGQISPLHLKDMGISWVILGHSQRRTLFGETDVHIAQKIANALQEGIKVIACFGELLEEREGGRTFQVLQKQLNPFLDVCKGHWDKIVLAYEPVWAIGTGKVATPQQIKEVHDWIRDFLDKVGQQTKSTPVIYGGSVNEKNCMDLLKVQSVGGFLVGGASLKPAFLDIIKACEAAE